MTRFAWPLALLACACGPSALTKSTAIFAQAAKGTASDLSEATGMVRGLCQDQARLEFLQERLTVAPGDAHAADSWSAFYADHTIALPLPDGSQPTWKAYCNGYQPADDVADKIVAALGAYASALLDATGLGFDGAHIKSITTSLAADAAIFAPSAPLYQSALAGAGDPIAKIADGITRAWVGKHVKDIVAQANKPVGDALAIMKAFVEAVRQPHGQLDDARASLRDAVAVAHGRASTIAAHSPTPMIQIPSEAIAAFNLDVAWTRRFDATDAKLVALSTALKGLAEAQTKLADASAHEGSPIGREDLKAVGTSVAGVSSALAAFKAADNDPYEGGHP